MTRDELDLIALYVEETKLSETIVAAFVHAGIEPPPRDRVDSIGFTTREAKVIEKAMVRRQPEA